MAALTKKDESTTAKRASLPAGAKPKIFLIGMMGAGKSYWANRIKGKLKLQTYDLDNIIEMMEERTIQEIFHEDGEPYFRKAEAKMLRLFGEKKQFVLSCGGGTPCHHDNMKWMNSQGITIWIDEQEEVLLRRLTAERSHRPAIAQLNDEGILQFIRTKLSERTLFYQQASHHLKGDALTDAAFLKIVKQHA